MSDRSADALHVLAHGHLLHGAPDRALGLALAGLRLNPDQPRFLRLVARALLDSGRAAEALATLDELALSDPEPSGPSGAQILRARALWRLGRRAEARALITAPFARPGAPGAGGLA